MRNLQGFGHIFAVLLFWQPFADNFALAGILHSWKEMTGFDIAFEEVRDCSAYEPIVGGYPVNGMVTHRVVFYQRGDNGMHKRIKTRHKYHFLIVKSKQNENENRMVFFKVEHQQSLTSAGISIFLDSQTYNNVDHAKVACNKILNDMAITTRSGWSLVQDTLNLKWAQIALFKKLGLLLIVHFLILFVPAIVCIVTPFEHVLIYGGLALNAVFGTAFTAQSIKRRYQRSAAKGGISQTHQSVNGVNVADLLEDECDKPLALYEQLLVANAGKFAAASIRKIRNKFRS